MRFYSIKNTETNCEKIIRSVMRDKLQITNAETLHIAICHRKGNNNAAIITSYEFYKLKIGKMCG